MRSRANAGRVLLYLVLSACATGIVEGIGGCKTYGGRGNFFECFVLYAMPIPMALGVLKIPIQVGGAIICGTLIPRHPRFWAAILACSFLAGLIFHLVQMFQGHSDTWEWFAYVTVDLAILCVMAACTPDPEQPPRS